MTKEQIAPGVSIVIEGGQFTVEADNVYLGDGLETLYDKPVNDIRIRQEEPPEDWPSEDRYQAIVEVKYVHADCGGVNWIQMGTDPGEYRCVKCTMFL